MKRFLAILAMLSTAMLLLPGASAWHSQNEATNTQFLSTAGDERVKEDGAECMAAVGEFSPGDAPSTHCIVLYGHNYDLLNPVPINIQRPPECAPNLAQGFTGTPGIEPFWEFSRAVLYSSAGFVEYKETECSDPDNRPRIHPERGLTSDVQIAQDADILGYWYLSVDTLEFSPAGINTPGGQPTPLTTGVMPCVTVRMEVQLGRFPGGTVIADGQTTKTIVSTPADAPDAPEIPQDACPESEGPIQPQEVTEFKVNLGQATGPIPEHQGYIVYVMWYQHDGGEANDKNNVIQREWNRHNGAEYPNRVIIPVQESIRVERVRPQEFDNRMFIHTVLNSPWGSYDVDTENIRVEIFDEGGQKVDIQHLGEPILRYSVDHDGHFKPVNATFPWEYKEEDLPEGTYTVKVTVPNWQHTAEASRSATFTLKDNIVVNIEDGEGGGNSAAPGDAEESPATAALLTALALLGLAGAAMIRRRQ